MVSDLLSDSAANIVIRDDPRALSHTHTHSFCLPHTLLCKATDLLYNVLCCLSCFTKFFVKQLILVKQLTRVSLPQVVSDLLSDSAANIVIRDDPKKGVVIEGDRSNC